MSQLEQSLEQQLNDCENVIDDLLHDRLGDSKNAQRNEKLKNCIQTLQSMSDTIERLALFSANDVADELPTSSLRCLLVPAYMACALQEVQSGTEKRRANLVASKHHYREFLQNLLIFELINFKLPWLDNENQDEGNSGLNAQFMDSYEEAKSKRQRAVNRIQQLEQFENALEALRIQQRRDDDEATQRQIINTLLQLWSIRAMKELDIIEDELKLLEQRDSQMSGDTASSSNASRSAAAQSVRLKPFIIAKSEAQKRVFGLGYPSVPTVTVDEWCSQMQKTGGFGNKAAPSSFTIDQQTKRETPDDEQNEEAEEQRRQAQIRRDEWKDVNPRGWGNTYRKG